MIKNWIKNFFNALVIKNKSEKTPRTKINIKKIIKLLLLKINKLKRITIPPVRGTELFDKNDLWDNFFLSNKNSFLLKKKLSKIINKIEDKITNNEFI